MGFNIGYVTAILSAVCNGCFAVIFKQYRKQIHPMVFTSFFSIGFSVLFLLTIPFDYWNAALTNSKFLSNQPAFCPFGLLSGVTIPGTFNPTWFAVRVPTVGLAITQGIVSTFNSLVSFLVGVLIFGTPIVSSVGAVVGIGLFCGGIAGIITAKQMSKSLHPSTFDDYHDSKSQIELKGTYGSIVDDAACTTLSGADMTARKRTLFGFACAVCAGTVGGFTLAGLQVSSSKCQGIVYLPSVGLGCCLTQILWYFFYYWTCLDKGEVRTVVVLGEVVETTFQSRRAFVHQIRRNLQNRLFLPGIAAGFIYGLGLILNLISVYYLGFALAGPLFQFNVLLDGIWGIFLFGEVRGFRPISLFFISAIAMVTAAMVLAQSTGGYPSSPH